MALPACVIVGYGPGNGQGIAGVSGQAGFALGLIARTPDKMAGPLAGLRSAGYPAELFAADAGDEASLTAGLRAARGRLGEAEVLIHNAAACRAAPPTVSTTDQLTADQLTADQLTADQLTADFQTYVAGALTATNFVLPAMKARRGGAVLFPGACLARPGRIA